jgi:Arc/MetJ-type ribon-helix-helix transcriptional regulator
MNIALPDDLQRLLRRKVETGQFSSTEAVVEEALKRFLIEEPNKEHPPTSSVAELPKGRLPGPFLEDESVPAPGDLPRSGQEVACRFLRDGTRQPGIFPGEELDVQDPR